MQALGGPAAAAAAVGAVCAPPPSAANSSHSNHSSLPFVSNHQEAATEDHEEEAEDECCCTAEIRPIASLEDFLSRMEELSGLRRELVPLFLSLPSCSTWATEERETAGARPRRRAQRKALRTMRELLAALQAIPEDEDGFKALPMSDGSSSAEEDNCKENKTFDDSKQKQLLQPLLQLQPHSKVVRRSFGYTIAELLKDIYFVLNGEDALINDYFPKLHPNFTNEVHSVVSMLQRATKSNDPQDQPIPFQCFVTDRDGTINNYCATYNSSFQSLYNAVFLSRFVLPSSAPEHINTNDNANNVQKQQTKTKKKVIHPIIMTSAPLSGLCAVSVNPSHSMIYAGSKGREFLDLSGRLHKSFIDPRKQRLLDKLNAKLEALVALPQYEKFTMIGSGLQEKFGQTTIARQDTNRSVPVEESLAWLSTVRQVVDLVELEEAEAKEQRQPLSNHKSDKEEAEEEEAEGQEEAERNKTRPQDHQKNFMIEDTGLDIEIILTIEDNSNASVVRDFHKGDGLAFLCEELGLSMQRGPHLVCGDTSSDVPMLEEALRHCPRQTFAVFVTKEEALRRRVREAFLKQRREEEGQREENVVFVSEPDVLVTALNVFARLH
ncbi:Trehalose 6-phosphate synthase [Balamuthia mandrillaris]